VFFSTDTCMFSLHKVHKMIVSVFSACFIYETTEWILIKFGIKDSKPKVVESVCIKQM
jgi:hypothetical protein